MATSFSPMPKATRLVLEGLYLWGVILGAIGCLVLADHRSGEDLMIGVVLLVLALGNKAVSHQSLTSSHLNYFYRWGELLAVLAGVLIFLTFPWSLGYRVILAVLLGGLAVGLHRQYHQTGIVWQGLVVVGLALSLIIGYAALAVAPRSYWPLAFGYAGLCLLFAWRYRWRRRAVDMAGPKSVLSPVKDTAVPGIEDLWQRGRLYEILDLPRDHTRLDLSSRYAQKDRLYDGNDRAKSILKETYTTLMVKEDCEMYRKSREVMGKIRTRCGEKQFAKTEAEIWKELWPELNLKYNLQPEKITSGVQDELVNKYTRDC